MTETTEVLAPEAVAPVAETQTPATDAQQAEVAQPEEGQEPAKELTPAEKEARALKRRVDRLTRERYQERAQFDAERQQWQQKPQEATAAPNQQEELQRVIQTEAKRLAEQISAQESLQKQVDSVLKAGQSIPDFTVACNAVDAEVPFFVDGRPSAFLRAVLDSDKPAQLLEHLSKDLEATAALASLSPSQLGRRLERIELEMAPKAREPSRAPRPLEPVKAVASPGIPDPATNPAAWREWRNKTAKR